MEAYREENRKVKYKCIYMRAKRNEDVNEYVNENRKMFWNEDVNKNRKMFWKEVSNAKGEKVESCNRINDGNGRLSQGKD